MADAPTAGAARYASVAEVRADVERAGGDASALCGFGRCLCFKTALGISGGKERGTASRHQRNTWGMLVRRAMRSTSRGRLPSILVSLVLATMQTTCSPPEKHQKVRHTKSQYRLQQQSSTAI